MLGLWLVFVIFKSTKSADPHVRILPVTHVVGLYRRQFSRLGHIAACRSAGFEVSRRFLDQPVFSDSPLRPSSKRITDFSYPRPFVPKNERSLWRTFVPQERKFQELSFPRPFVLGNFRSWGTKVHGNFRSWDLSYPSHYPIGLVAALLCVLNYCMFGCDFTLMMLTPLCTSQLTLYVGRPAFAARLSVFDVPITVYCAQNA